MMWKLLDSVIWQVYYYSIGLDPPLVYKSAGLCRLYSHMRHPGTCALTVILLVHPHMTASRALLALILGLYTLFRWAHSCLYISGWTVQESTVSDAHEKCFLNLLKLVITFLNSSAFISCHFHKNTGLVAVSWFCWIGRIQSNLLNLFMNVCGLSTERFVYGFWNTISDYRMRWRNIH